MREDTKCPYCDKEIDGIDDMFSFGGDQDETFDCPYCQEALCAHRDFVYTLSKSEPDEEYVDDYSDVDWHPAEDGKEYYHDGEKVKIIAIGVANRGFIFESGDRNSVVHVDIEVIKFNSGLVAWTKKGSNAFDAAKKAFEEKA